MFVRGKSIKDSDFNWSFLQKCREERTEETWTLDFKDLGPYTSSVSKKDGPRRDFLQDVCGFANAGGGVLLYGISGEKEAGKNTERMGELVGFDPKVTISEYRNALQAMVREGLEPQSSGIEVVPVENPSGGHPIFAVGVEPSFLAPHRLRSGSKDFFTRNATDTIVMSIESVRHAFVMAEERRTAAELAISAALKAVPWPTGYSFEADGFVGLWAAVCPTYQRALSVPMRSDVIKRALQSEAKDRPYFGNLEVRYDHDGAFLSRHLDRFAVDRIYPNGMIRRLSLVEGTNALLAGETQPDGRIRRETIPGEIRRRSLLAGLREAFAFFGRARENLGIVGPAILWVALLGARDTHGSGHFLANFDFDDDTYQGWKRRALLHPPIIDLDLVLEKVDVSDETLQAALKDVADGLWRAAGHRECAGVDEDGKLVEGIR